jgi:hypothetical protein
MINVELRLVVDVVDMKIGFVIQHRPSPNGEACLPVGRDKRMRSKDE